MRKIDQYRLEEGRDIAVRMDEAADALKVVVEEMRKLIPESEKMSNGYANVTPETEQMNRATSRLWNVLDHYSDIQYNRMNTTMALMDTRAKLEREQEKVHEQRERAEEAEELAKELQRDYGNRRDFVKKFYDMLLSGDRAYYVADQPWFAALVREMGLR